MGEFLKNEPLRGMGSHIWDFFHNYHSLRSLKFSVFKKTALNSAFDFKFLPRIDPNGEAKHPFSEFLSRFCSICPPLL